MKIANIVSQSKINVPDDFNVVESYNLIIPNLPTLVVGWAYLNRNFKEYDIINRKINDNTYWTFKRNEKREIYEEDLYNFTHKAYETLVSNVTYFFIDTLRLSIKNIKKLLLKINSAKDIITYVHDNMVYIYCEKIIFGLNLEFTDYVGVSRQKLLDKIRLKSIVYLTKEDNFIEYKNKLDYIDNKVRYIPFLHTTLN